ncbi:hypothetical protein PISMIDRAFT_679425 [Pisolithus microcarpus 441]|uniref:Unplaced genomic scaffold scaffold_42, whole genome shotgun sequence n=1 Tax=Pisolithus microcarpus 441 TaxID=765257 RepID=A0A0C9ZUW7_9AGAM|nr:hypothetical protein PISMIDRAFT_679425 [Pisolithus microcarpus 441]
MRHTERHRESKVICVSYTNNTSNAVDHSRKASTNGGIQAPNAVVAGGLRDHGCSGGRGMSFKVTAVQQSDEMSFHFRSAHPLSSPRNIAECSPSHSRQGGQTSCSLLTF